MSPLPFDANAVSPETDDWLAARGCGGAPGDKWTIMQLMPTSSGSAAPNIPALSAVQNCIRRTVGTIFIANRNHRARECVLLDCAGRATALAWGRADDGRRRFFLRHGMSTLPRLNFGASMEFSQCA